MDTKQNCNTTHFLTGLVCCDELHHSISTASNFSQSLLAAVKVSGLRISGERSHLIARPSAVGGLEAVAVGRRLLEGMLTRTN